ncbi:sigma factor-like helix-turn-helix DNA-binding protein [Propionibacteriaceae bacterium Y1923]
MARREDVWLRELYEAQWDPMVRLATLLLGSASTAPDLVQEALLATHQRRRHFDTLEQAEVYLRVAVVNRTRAVRRADPPTTRTQEILARVAALPQRQREVLVLRYFLGLGDPDIAATLGISRSAVASHGHRGVLAIGAQFEGGTDPDESLSPEPLDAVDAEATEIVIMETLAERGAEVEVPERRAEVMAETARTTSTGGSGGRRFRWLVTAALCALLVGLALPVVVPGFSLLGRVQQTTVAPSSTAGPSPHVPPSLPTLQRDLPVYYVGADRLLYREFRDLPTQGDRLSTAVGAVLNVAPQDSAYSSLWAGGQVNSATIVGPRIVIDISAAAFANFTDRAVVDAAINQVVYTAIAAVGDQSGERSVQILIDGSPNLPVIGTPTADFTRNGVVPLGRLWILTPGPVTPLPAGEMTLRGYQQVALSDTTIRWEVLDADEHVVRQGTVAATGNEQGWRYWVAAVILPAGEYELRVWTTQIPEQRRHFTVA